MKFRIVAQRFDQLEQESSRIEMTKLLADLFAKANEKEISIVCYLSLGILRPLYIGTQFNFAAKSLRQVVAQLLDRPLKEITQLAKEIGDLGGVLSTYAVHKPAKSLSLIDVYESLCSIEETQGEGSQQAKAQQTLELLRHLDPLAGKYVIRIMLGTLRLGFSDMTIVDALSWMETRDKSLRATIEDAYNKCADIGFIARTLKKDGVEALREMTIHVGVPIRPAAAERLPTAQAIFDKIGPCVAQPKLDGFRLQIHIDNTGREQRINFFSRHLIDMSYMFPDLVDALSHLEVQQLIVEGEAIAFDPNTGTFLPFQETVKRKRKHGIEQAVSEFPLRVYLFDLLYLDDKQYLTVAHRERRALLETVLKGYQDDRVQLVEEKAINSVDDLERYFNEQMTKGLEGIVVKKPNALYQPGKRNFNWIKFKRQQEGQLEDTIDCVILGYYAGAGKRAAFGIGAFLVGVFNRQEDRVETIAKIGTGLSDEAWKDLKKRADALSVAVQPKNVICAKELYPDVWVYPEIVCSIRADEITLSPLHTAGKKEEQLGFALRFPRFISYRPDKGPEETTSIEELQRLYEDQFS